MARSRRFRGPQTPVHPHSVPRSGASPTSRAPATLGAATDRVPRVHTTNKVRLCSVCVRRWRLLRVYTVYILMFVYLYCHVLHTPCTRFYRKTQTYFHHYSSHTPGAPGPLPRTPGSAIVGAVSPVSWCPDTGAPIVCTSQRRQSHLPCARHARRCHRASPQGTHYQQGKALHCLCASLAPLASVYCVHIDVCVL